MKLNTINSAFFAALLLAATAGCDQNSSNTSMAPGTNAPATNASSTNLMSRAAMNATTNVDNTKINERDRNSTNLTAQNQGNSDADTKLSAAIRKMVVSSTNNFSTAAQNIKIITQNGKVTLRGPVTTDSERTHIESIAKGIAGDANVENDLEVKASN